MDGAFGDGPPAHWRAVARQPRPWLRAYAGATSQVWSAVRPVWREARPWLSPSAITYHCEHLSAAGLVRRERRGREVHVTRTPRAERLAELFDT